jgi:hypothetical protein
MHDLEKRLKRDARAVEETPPERMMAGLHARLAHESGPMRDVPRRAPRPLLAAAAVVLAAGGLLWAVSSLGRNDGSTDGGATDSGARDGGASIAATTTNRTSATPGLEALSLASPSRGMALVGRVDEPLSREWQNLKHDSQTLLRGFERQIPLLAARD